MTIVDGMTEARGPHGPAPGFPTIRTAYAVGIVEGVDRPFDRVPVALLYPSVDLHGPDPSYGQLPLVVISGRQRIDPSAYRWLAEAIASQGFLVALPMWLTPDAPGDITVRTGLSADALDRVPRRRLDDNSDLESFGGVGSPLVGAVLDACRPLVDAGPLAGAIDLDNIALVGHSDGATASLLAAHPDVTPGVAAVVAYGPTDLAHTAISDDDGLLVANSVVVLPSSVPSLIAEGRDDGHAIHRPEAVHIDDLAVEDERTVDPIRLAFQHGLAGGRRDSFLAEFDGANHDSLLATGTDLRGIHVPDRTAGGDPRQFQRFFGGFTGLFLRAHCRREGHASVEMEAFLQEPPSVFTTLWRR